MATKFSNGIDLVKSALLNAVIQNLATGALPASPLSGQIAYDSTINAMVVWNGTAWISTDASKVANGYISLAKLATDPLARANHTGTQNASTIIDFDTQVRTSRLNQMAAPNADVTFNTQKLTNLGAAIADTDALTLGQAKTLLYGALYRRTAKAAATVNVNIANPGTATFDTVVLANGDLLLLPNTQTTASERGLYVFNGSAAPLTRALDADSNSELRAGLEVYVEQGAANNNKIFRLDTDNPITVGTTALSFTDTGTVNVYTAGNGISIVSNVVTAVAAVGGGLLVGGGGIAINASLIPRKVATFIVGDGTTTQFTVIHNFGTRNVGVWMRERAAPYASWQPDNQADSINSVTILFAAAPANLVEYDILVVA